MGGLGGGPGSFPAPGVPGGGAGAAPGDRGATDTGAGAGSAPPPPLFNPWFPPPPSSGGGASTATGTPGAVPGAGMAPNPYASMFDPAAMQQMLGMLGGGPGLGGFGAPPAPPADSRSPEERFQVQLEVRFFQGNGRFR